MAAIPITTEMFYEMTSGSTPVLVDYWAPWCTYCRRIEPAYEKIAEAYGDRVIVTKVNIDREQLLAIKKSGILFPSFLLLRNQ